jgi:hypothetical protein
MFTRMGEGVCVRSRNHRTAQPSQLPRNSACYDPYLSLESVAAPCRADAGGDPAYRSDIHPFAFLVTEPFSRRRSYCPRYGESSSSDWKPGRSPGRAQTYLGLTWLSLGC